MLTRCSENKVIVPGDVLNEKEMTAILTDIHIAQASQNKTAIADTISTNMNEYLPSIFKNHKTDREKFLRSLKFYSDNPEILQEVYDSVITGLSKMEAGMEK